MLNTHVLPNNGVNGFNPLHAKSILGNNLRVGFSFCRQETVLTKQIKLQINSGEVLISTDGTWQRFEQSAKEFYFNFPPSYQIKEAI